MGATPPGSKATIGVGTSLRRQRDGCSVKLRVGATNRCLSWGEKKLLHLDSSILSVDCILHYVLPGASSNPCHDVLSRRLSLGKLDDMKLKRKGADTLKHHYPTGCSWPPAPSNVRATHASPSSAFFFGCSSFPFHSLCSRPCRPASEQRGAIVSSNGPEEEEVSAGAEKSAAAVVVRAQAHAKTS